MTEHENMRAEGDQPERDPTVEDLDVPEGQQEGVAGGLKGESTDPGHKGEIEI